MLIWCYEAKTKIKHYSTLCFEEYLSFIRVKPGLRQGVSAQAHRDDIHEQTKQIIV